MCCVSRADTEKRFSTRGSGCREVAKDGLEGCADPADLHSPPFRSFILGFVDLGTISSG